MLFRSTEVVIHKNDITIIVKLVYAAYEPQANSSVNFDSESMSSFYVIHTKCDVRTMHEIIFVGNNSHWRFVTSSPFSTRKRHY